tara:strand:- start:8329 stop:8682 length:354 start_codon:yes stop_codon:yes gene_type:complete
MIIKFGVIFSILSIIIGAFGSHALNDIIGEKMEVFKTGIQYHMFHSLALIIVAIISKTLNIPMHHIAYLFVLGIIFFSGSLYLLSIYKYSFIGIITPIGGLFFILGWVLLLNKIFTI